MRRIHLDFAPRSWAYWLGRVSVLVWCGVLVLCLLALTGGVRLWWLNAAVQRTQADVQAVQQTGQRQVSPRQLGEQSLTDEQRQALNRVVTQLNQPWAGLLDALENTVTAQIALLSLNFEPAGQRLRGTAEARNFKSMIAFIERLDSSPVFHSAQLLNHYVDPEAAEASLRFEFSVHWRGTMP